ncbi:MULTISPECIES: AAA family ATPase [unclassified Staphylococcus]|uniref:AAA family ATPase n=1 Tax=unclassified Staphylococcus TaxID=91994 RepID=UPI00187E4A70|nr:MULTISPECIES: AAA family ATPase [unclassified Staphylococcus]MBF2757769.1 AAA family ATPase [Staphylococcus haemolyticus]MBF2774517.1 AAA family ATPase [Staphylococcus haemolyticus]MBF2776966.1 AAA family ATPase [Staphylococcus haemolyticus]MBF2816434.1 AAA family ATPase [Staphylococcus haemolyticus]MBF9721521.1 AAA family ATPase [Staphylococcus haemolyticus]
MIIKSLEIYGYGQFVHRKIEFNREFTEIFGENEAGKSTIQAFIHSILFGFPSKKEKEPRLEPRMGNQYGGKLTLILDDQSEIVVERVKGSVSGDVKVYLENGLIRDEAWLKKKLNYISKKTYQGIFSFNVLGLQDIHRNLDEDQLQSYLLEAGALGSSEFTMMNKMVSQKKTTLYKKAGKNPILNQQLEELKQLEAQIREEEAKVDEYHRLVDDRDKSQRHLEHLKANLNQLSKMHESKQKQLAIHEQAQEWKDLEQRLNIEPLRFPEKGIERYETASNYKQSLTRDISLREEKLKQLEHEYNAIVVSNETTAKHIYDLTRDENEMQQAELKSSALEQDIDDYERQEVDLKSSIGWQEVHHDTDTSDAKKNYVSETIKARNEQNVLKQQIERSIDENQIEQNALTQEIDHLEKELVPEDALDKKKQYNQQKLELHEKENLYNKLKDTFNSDKERKQQRNWWLRLSFIVLSVIGLGLTIFSFVTQNLIFGIIFAILTVVFIIGIFLVRTKEIDYSESISEEINDLEQQINDLESEYDLNFDLDQQFQLRERWSNASNNKSVLANKLNHQESLLQKTEEQINTLTHQLDEVKANLKLPNNMTDDLLLDSFKTMNQLKSNDSYRNKLKHQHQEVNQKLDQFYQTAHEYTEHEISPFNKASLFTDLKNWISNYESKREKKEQLKNQIELLSNELKQLKEQLEENEHTIDTLFNYIEVSSEEAYYQSYEQYQLYHQQLTRFNDLTLYLENQDFSYEDSSDLSEKTTAQLEEEDATLAKQVDDYNDQYLDKQTEVSDLTAQINYMETDKTLSKLRHEYYNLKNRMNDLAKDWASLSYLEALINEHIKQIKDKRLPQVINEAVNIFTSLTQGNYNLITYENDTIMVKHNNGQMYHPLELSQSTKELLYIALRISLIKILRPYYPFPIIIDDAFVHFDKQRKSMMLNYLRELAKDYQVLYFTCMKDTAIPSKEMLILNKVEEGGKR